MNINQFCAAIVTIIAITCSADPAENLHRYMWANYNQFGGNRQQASRWYEQMQNPSIYSNKGYVHLLNDTGNHQRIVDLMPRLSETFRNDPDLQLIFVAALRKVGKNNESDDLLLRLSQTFKTHPEIIFNAAETLVKRKELTNAIAIIDDFLNCTPKRANNFIFYFLKSQIYTKLNDQQQALTNVKLCLQAHPRFPQGWLLLALLEEQSGKIDKAIEGYTSYLEITGGNKNIEQHVLGLALKQKASSQNKQVILINKSCFEKALILFERKQYKPALQQVDQCLTQNPQEAQYRLLKLQILTAMKDYAAVTELLTIWSTRETDNQLWLQVLHLLPRATHETASTISAFEKIHATHPQQLLPILYLADLHTRAHHSDQALTYHQKALALTDNIDLKTRILFQIGLTHYEKGHHDLMFKAIDQACALGTNYPPALNLLAYHYATETKNYAKASDLIEKALAQDKNNPHFLDTKAVILYKQKKYAEALALLERIAPQIPHDSTALIHLAKTHHKMGNVSQAVTVIHEAQKYAHNTYEKEKSALLLSQWKQ